MRNGQTLRTDRYPHEPKWRSGQWQLMLPFMLVLALCSCGGTRMLDKPVPVTIEKPLASTRDANIQFFLDWVIVRDGPGSWARSADWDEYLIRIVSLTDEAVTVRQLVIHDLSGYPVVPEKDRKRLKKASTGIFRRYWNQGFEVEAGMGDWGMLVTGGVLTATGVVAVEGAAAASVLSGGGGVGLAAGLILAGPAMVIGGATRMIRSHRVNREIERRQTLLPMTLPAARESSLDVFFPMAPSPRSLEIKYVKDAQEHSLDLDLHTVLEGLHLGEIAKSKPPRGGHRGQHRIF